MNDNGIPDSKIEPHPISAKASFEHLLCHNGVVIVIDGSCPDIVVPAHLHGQQFTLQYELDPVVPIPDLEVTDDGVRATLSFDRTPFATFVPWAAVRAMGPMRPEPVEAPPKRTALKLV